MGGVKTILLVDDEQEVIDLILRRMFLRHAEEFEPLVALDGYEALEFLRTKVVDLAVVDIRMRNLDGMEVCRRALRGPRTKRVPIIVSSGCLGAADRRELVRLGVRHFLDKPYRMDDLFALMRKVLEETQEEGGS